MVSVENNGGSRKVIASIYSKSKHQRDPDATAPGTATPAPDLPHPGVRSARFRHEPPAKHVMGALRIGLKIETDFRQERCAT
ncbi:hypothetical protein [Rhizobium sp. X9]|uniref:hypothetical protein n=1 Tax=Rhizobium sp. X9 TaxID=2815360 RepID=UPI001C0AAF87|nr:hypothetical protein [Rhizobium sp. X9]